MSKGKIVGQIIVIMIVIFGFPGMGVATSLLTFIKTQSAYDPAAAFPKTGLYAFIEAAPSLPDTPGVSKLDLESRIRQGIIDALSAKGFRLKLDNPARPAFLIGFNAAMEGVASMPFVSGIDVQNAPWLSALSGQQGFRRAVLVIDVIHPVNRKLLWRGVAQANLLFDDKLSQQDRDQRTTNMVRQTLGAFPPN